MSELKMFSLNQECKDKATGRKVTITHALLGSTGVIYYQLQPQGVNPKTGLPVTPMRAAPDRIEGAKETENITVPLDVIGTKVTDKASGLKGVVISLIMHPGNCLHCAIQPTGIVEGGESPDPVEIDIRRLSGPAIPVLTRAEQKASEKRTPSPAYNVLVSRRRGLL